MKLASLRYQGEEKAEVLVPGGILPLELLNRKLDWEYPHDLLHLIETGSLETIRGWYQAGGEKELPDFRDLLIPDSEVMTLLPGDIISTGTPGAALIQDGDRVECRIDGFETLMNPVRDLKKV
jgi:hypothetical protein